MKIVYFPSREDHHLPLALQSAFEDGLLPEAPSVETPRLLTFLNVAETRGTKADVILLEIDFESEKKTKGGRKTVQTLSEIYGGDAPPVFILDISGRALNAAEKRTINRWFPESASASSHQGWVRIIPALCEAADMELTYPLRAVPDRISRCGDYEFDFGRGHCIRREPMPERPDTGTPKPIGRMLEGMQFALKRQSGRALAHFFEASLAQKEGNDPRPKIDMTTEENAFLHALATAQGDNRPAHLLLNDIYTPPYLPPAERLELLYMNLQSKLEAFGAKGILARNERHGTFRMADWDEPPEAHPAEEYDS